MCIRNNVVYTSYYKLIDAIGLREAKYLFDPHPCPGLLFIVGYLFFG